jgi:ERCC4-type nuclease
MYLLMTNRREASRGEESVGLDDSHAEDADQPTLTALQQVGDDRAEILYEADYECVEDVATASQNALTDVEGIGSARAATIVESANTLLDSTTSAVADERVAWIESKSLQ